MAEKERIEEIRIFFKFNKKTFSEVLGYAYAQNYTNFLSGGSKLSMKMIRGLKEYDSRINIDWILTGQGQMLINTLNGGNNVQKIKNNDGNVTQVNDSHNNFNTKTNSTDLERENSFLKKENEHLKQMLEAKEEIIQLLKK